MKHFPSLALPIRSLTTAKLQKNKTLDVTVKDKLAILIGIEYVHYASTGELNRLPGCHNDLFIMRDILMDKFGFASGDIEIMTDASDMYTQPTYDNVLQSFNRAVNRAHDGTLKHLIVYYSGHGTQVRDDTGQERDGEDECMVPCDFRTAGFLTDKTLSRTLLTTLPVGIKCTIISDSCNSGTLFDLPYMYSEGKMVASSDMPIQCMADVVTLSGCRDDQTSASAYNLERANGWRGAMTLGLQEAWKQYGFQSNVQNIIEGCRTFLAKNNYTQIPQLCTSSAILPQQEAFL
jgi:hypothetical protein